MSGARLAAIAVANRWIPFVLYDECTTCTPQFGTAVWGVRESGDSLTRLSARGDTLNDVDFMDPERSPADANKFIFATTPIGAGASLVRLLDISAGVPGIAQTCATQTSTLVTSMQPWWHPTDSLVVYRNLDDAPNEASIRTCDPTIGAPSLVILRTVSRFSVGNIHQPKFNRDGSLIAFMVDSAVDGNAHLWVMNADGTGATDIANMGSPSPSTGFTYGWFHNSDVIAYNKFLSGPVDMEIRKINADGTGDTLLYTDTDGWWGLTKRPVTPDDTQILYFRRDFPTPLRFRLVSVDTSGGGATPLSPDRLSLGGVADDLAYIYANRVYWAPDPDSDSGTTPIYSCAFDGSGLRTEAQMGPVDEFDALNWTGGFAGFLNQ